MRARTLVVVLFAVLLARPVWAQEQKGVIEGVVKDQQGGAIPGAAVEAKSAAGATLTTTSDQNGTYRFPSLQPGTYEVSAKLTGFRGAKVDSVQVTVEAIKKVDFTLQVGSVSESVMVTAAAPLVDVKSSERSTIIRGGDQGLPAGRDFTTLLSQAPGVNFEAKFSGTAGYTGISVDGASGAENRYVIDGMETTDIIHGQSGKNLLTDFVDEIQIKSTGYSAEFGGATGGVINVITKSGTNKIKGTFLDNYQGSRLQGQPNQTLRRLLSDSSKAEYVRYAKDKVDRNEVGLSIGGPILSNKAWYFAAYQPANTKTTRNVTQASAVNPNGNPSGTTNKDQIQYLTATQTTQMGSKLRTRVSFNNSWEKTEGLLAALDASDKAGTDYSKGTRLPNYSISGTADYSASPNFVVGARVGRYLQDAHDFNVQNVVRFLFNNSNVGQAGVPGNFQHPSGYNNVPNNSGIDHDARSRNYFQLDATYYAHGAGVGSSRVDLQACKLEYSIVSPK